MSNTQEKQTVDITATYIIGLFNEGLSKKEMAAEIEKEHNYKPAVSQITEWCKTLGLNFRKRPKHSVFRFVNDVNVPQVADASNEVSEVVNIDAAPVDDSNIHGSDEPVTQDTLSQF